MAVCPTGFATTVYVEPDMIPIGSIIMWSGSIANIPEHFQICDGANGTPDLRNRFVLGAGDTYAVNGSGGAETHDHVYHTNDHEHMAQISHSCPGSGSIDAATIFGAGNIAAAGSAESATDSASSLPSYLALAYIQRMS